MVHERQPAQGAHASGQQSSRNAIEHQRIQPRGDRYPQADAFGVMVRGVQPSQQDFLGGEGNARSSFLRGGDACRIRIDVQPANVR